MKSILLSITVLLFASGTLSQETKLNPAYYENNTLIKDLRQLGAEYTLEMGIFTKTPPLPNGYWSIYKTENFYQSIANGVTYYKYIVHLLCQSDPYLIRATYTVSFRSSNGNTKITQFFYTKMTPPDKPVVADGSTFINNVLLVPGSDLQNLLDIGLEFTINGAMSEGLLKKSKAYSFSRLFSIQDVGVSTPPGYNFLIQIVNAEGYYYRARIVVYDNSDPDSENAYQPEYTIYRTA